MRFEKIQRGGVSSATKPKALPAGRTLIRHRPSHRTTRNGKVSHSKLAVDTAATFVGVDGEGITVTENGKKIHRYVLLGIGDEQIADPNGLSWKTCFEFLYKHFKPGTAYVGFYLGYDFTQMLKTLPESRASVLLTQKGRDSRKHRIKGKAPHPVEYGGWQFDILAMKRLRIRPKRCDCPYASCKCDNKAPWMYICDAGSFFQSSFLTVINPKKWKDNPVCTNEEYALIEKGKKKRATAHLDDDMMMYNRLENQVLARVMHRLDEGFRAIGVHLTPSQWYGPGQAAQEWLKKEGVVKSEIIREKTPQWFREAARMSYFGGWFEIMMHGHIPGETHEYDINSAYPSIIETLPCLLHGKYSFGEGTPIVKPGDLCLVYATVWSPDCGYKRTGYHIGSMLHREPNGSIHRPTATQGWYWYDELKAAQTSGLIVKPSANKNARSKYLRWVKYEPCDCPPPMRKVRELYDYRLMVGKDTSAGKAAKTVYNSKYGKFAQSVGEPTFGNPVYASRITSECRRMIVEAIGSHPGGKAAVTMVATDAVYFLTPHPSLKESDQLGDWEHKVKRNLTQFKPGVYWDDETRESIAANESPHFKARGFRASDFTHQIVEVDRLFSEWDGLTKRYKWPSISFKPTFGLTTCLQALIRKDWSLAGSVIDPDDSEIELTQNSDPHTKRNSGALAGISEGVYRAYTDDGRMIYRTEPLNGFNNAAEGDDQFDPSHPYEKRFGEDDPWSDENKEAAGVMQDGYVSQICNWIIVGGELR